MASTASSKALEEGRASTYQHQEDHELHSLSEKQGFSEHGNQDYIARPRIPTSTSQTPVLSGFNTDGLPTLNQVLARKTYPPVCLYNYYIVLRDRLHAEEQLDFYLDVRHHENLWRRFVKDARKSGVITEEDIQQGGHHLFKRLSHASLSTTNRPSSRLSDLPLLDRPSSPSTGRDSPMPGSSGMRYPPPSETEDTTDPRDREDPARLQAVLGPRDDPLTLDPAQGSSGGGGTKPRPTRAEIKASAEHIYYKYIVQSAEKELHQLPEPVRRRIMHAIETEKRDDPEVFAEAKQLVFDKMQVETFPKFLRAKVWSNTTMPQALIRMVIGLIFLFIGFAIVLSFIFLNWGPDWEKWSVRMWPLHLAPDSQYHHCRYRHRDILRRTGAQALVLIVTWRQLACVLGRMHW
ncbi:hypothetical protein BC937DRAFT_93291 [Endogone sp. FLAS-F59071]|nr:hypothetical protein BC937DRAFT_93291 [Endogone sp. FLAS-F59071]|eukprot:RUS21217.1 hypothetical protein BC937DRAFT_93291 [Endogone sp. FLAS-F59071]